MSKYYLKVPWKEKHHAKKVGAKFDPTCKLWYVPEGLNVGDFKRWSHIETPRDEIFKEGEKRLAIEANGYWQKKLRFIYVLFFKDNTVYVGQSGNPKKRFTHHRNTSFKNIPFEPIVVDNFYGNIPQGYFLEYAWRYRAYLDGYVVIPNPSLGENVEGVNVALRANQEAREHAKSLKWPDGYPQRPSNDTRQPSNRNRLQS